MGLFTHKWGWKDSKYNQFLWCLYLLACFIQDYLKKKSLVALIINLALKCNGNKFWLLRNLCIYSYVRLIAPHPRICLWALIIGKLCQISISCFQLLRLIPIPTFILTSSTYWYPGLCCVTLCKLLMLHCRKWVNITLVYVWHLYKNYMMYGGSWS